MKQAVQKTVLQQIEHEGAKRMESLMHAEAQQDRSPSLTHQAVWLFVHTALALASWLALMTLGYVLNPRDVSQSAILFASMCVPLIVGFAFTRVRQQEMASLVWLVGIVWILTLCLWIIDLPTGPNTCMECDATEKLTRTFFSIPRPSGLIDNDGPFIGTWPAAALLGYSIGARLALRRKA